MDENRELLELLKKIEKTNRQQVRTGRLLCVFALVAVICCAVTAAMIFNVLPQLTAVMTQMETVLGNLEETTTQLAALDLERMVADVDALVVTGEESLKQTMEKLNAIDFETLNQAVGDLADVVKPLADFFNRFG